MKKKTFWAIAALFAFTTCTLYSQDTLSWRQTMARHDIQIGIGDPIFAGLLTNSEKILRYIKNDDPFYSPDSWFKQDVFRDYSYTTGAISAGYSYRLAKWLWVGGTVGYAGFHTNYTDRVTRKKAGADHTNFFMIMPSVRFSWINTRIVTLYSGLSLGYALATIRSYNDISGKTDSRIEHHAAFQITAVGVHVGTKWYGFTEIGVGTQGIISAGFGCQLKSGKNKKSK